MKYFENFVLNQITLWLKSIKVFSARIKACRWWKMFKPNFPKFWILENPSFSRIDILHGIFRMMRHFINKYRMECSVGHFFCSFSLCLTSCVHEVRIVQSDGNCCFCGGWIPNNYYCTECIALPHRPNSIFSEQHHISQSTGYGHCGPTFAPNCNRFDCFRFRFCVFCTSLIECTNLLS